ncbi:filamentous hemagglutinin N-terminal domain-containing protein [Xanthomonas cucurbitae]|nr:filamentous hemagglutinin N-terminal domain-containing protein [Xanthomonas cucurbitae]WDM75695.1 filamentous hemagglutinin N-terminal domain-containing protein [Xanthomonas cucurbitae]
MAPHRRPADRTPQRLRWSRRRPYLHAFRLHFLRDLRMHANHTAATAAARSPGALPPRSPLALALAAALTLSAPAAAQVASTQLPTNGSIVGGTGALPVPTGASQVITQTSDRMALTWSSFNLGADATLRFDQPSSAAVVLNLIGGSSASQIFGKLNANGQVFLVNSNGVLFGPGAQVNVGGLVASSLGMSAADFMNNGNTLDAGGGTSFVSNNGTITAAAGSVNLIGGQVVNNGTITATAGNITLAGANRATLNFESGGFGVVIETGLQSQLGGAAANNTDSLIAPGGTITLQASAARALFNQLVNNSGIISAVSLSDVGRDGNVSLVANGSTETSIGGSGSINVGSGSISYITEGSVQQTGTLTAGDLFASVSKNLLLTGENKIAKINGFIDGDLSLTNARDLGQGTALQVKGISTFALGSHALTLNTTSNDFVKAVNIKAGATSITDGNALTLGELTTGNLTAASTGALNLGSGTITGTLTATSNNGAITQANGLTVTGASSLNAGSGAITLTTGNNDFQQSVALTGGLTSIADGNALTLGTLNTGNLTATSNGALNLGSGTITGTLAATSNNGAITQANGLTVTGNSTLNAGSAGITLENADNEFQGAVGATGNGIALTDRNTLTVSSIAGNTSGNIVLNAQAITLPTSAITAGTGGLTLTANAGPLATQGALSGGNVVLDARDGLTLAHDITANNTLTLRTANAAIEQTAGQLLVRETTSANAGTAAISLTGNNDFQQAVTLSGGLTNINDRNALTLGTLNTGNLTATSNGALNLGSGTIDGILVATSNGGAVTQTGALLVTGTSTVDAGSGALVLNSDGNDFRGALTLAAGNAQIVDSNLLTLERFVTGALDVTSHGQLDLGQGSAGSLLAVSNGAAIGQAGALVIAGNSVIDAGAGAVTLNQAGNDFGGTVAVAAGAVQLRDAHALSLATSRMGSIAAVANGAIAQTGTLSVSGDASFDAGAGTIALTAPGNDFAGTVSLRGGAVGIADATALTLGRLDTSTLQATSQGDLNLGVGVVAGTLSARSNGGAIRQGGSLRVLGDAVLDAGAGAIFLNDPANDLAGKLTLNAAAARIGTATPLTLGMLNVGELHVSTVGALNLGKGTVGTLAASSVFGSVSQTGPLVVSGSSVIEANAGDVRLDNVGNDFVGALSVFSQGVTLVDRNALTLGNVGADRLTVTSTGALDLGMAGVRGDLRATSNGGAIGQAFSIGVGGDSMIDAGTGTITLTHRFNDFQGGVRLVGGASQIVDRNALSLETFAVTSLRATSNERALDATVKDTLSLGSGRSDGALTAISNGGDIVQRGALSVGGATTLDSSTGSLGADAGTITLTGNNAFAGTVSLTGGATQLTAGSALTLGTLDTGALTIASNGALNLGQGRVDGALTATSNGGRITQAGALRVNGTSTLNAVSGAIALDDAGNDFAGAVNAIASGIALVDRNDLQMASLQSSGNASVSLDAGGALQLPASAIDVGTGALSLTARGAVLTTTHAVRGGDVQLSGANGIALGEGITAGGTLSLRSTNAAITQGAGTLQVAGNSVVDAGSGAIVLDAAGNDFQGGLALTGGATRVRDANALSLDALDTGALNVTSNGALNLGFGLVNGDLDATSNGGAVSQTGALTVTGASRINSAGATIALADTGNDFQSILSLSGGDTRVRDRNALTLGNLDVGALDAASGAGLNLGQGRIGGTLLARSGTAAGSDNGRVTAQAIARPAATGADITQQGALTVLGNSLLDAGTGAIVLTDAGNDFQGSVQASGGSIALADRNALAAAVQSSGAVDLQAGGQLSSSGAITGNTVALTSGGAMLLGHDVATAGTLSLHSGGAITQRAGSLRVGQLNGSAAGAATLAGAGNSIGTLADVSAQGLDVFSATTLQVSGRVDGGTLLRLGSGAVLLLDGQLSGASTWLQATAGIDQRAGSTLGTNLLSGSAGGPVMLGDAATFIDNRVVRLGDFTAGNGFSLTNAGTLTLVRANGSVYSVDAGNSALFLSVRGDLLQEGRATLRDGTGSFSATGRIGTQQDPIYLIGSGSQTIGMVGAPPAYFDATTAAGGLLDLSGGSSFNVPASAFASRAQSSANRTIAFVDLSSSGTPYRAFGLVRPGLRLPDDQQPACDAGDPDAVCTPQ